MKNLALSIIVMLGIIGLFSCKSTKEFKSMNINETYKAKVGEIVKIEFPANPTTGFMWNLYKISDEKVVKFDKHDFIKNSDEKLIGAGGTDVWTFKATKKGEAIVALQLKRAGNDKVEETKAFKIIVE